MGLHKHFDFNQLGGFPINTDEVLGFMQEAYSDLSKVVAEIVGNNIIISGVETLPDGSWSDGWIVYNGELLPFKGGLFSAFFEIRNDNTFFIFEDGQNKEVKFNKYAQPSTSGIALSSLTRINPYKDISRLFNNRYSHQRVGSTYNIKLYHNLGNTMRIEGFIQIYSEDLVDGYPFKIPDFPFDFGHDDLNVVHAAAHFNKSDDSFTAVCEITAEQNGDLHFKALNMPIGKAVELYNCFVVFSNEFLLDTRGE